MKDITTTNLAEFGFREWKLVEELIIAKRDFGFPSDFSLDGVTIMFNKNSGYVFFTNDEYQVALENGGRLSMYYYCANCGHEGFEDEGFEKDKDHCICDECFEEEGNDE